MRALDIVSNERKEKEQRWKWWKYGFQQIDIARAIISLLYMSDGLQSLFTFVLLLRVEFFLLHSLPSETLEINSIPDIALFALVHRVGCWAPRWMSFSWHTYQIQFFWHIRASLTVKVSDWGKKIIKHRLLTSTEHIATCHILFIRTAAFVVVFCSKFLFCIKWNWSDNFYVVSGKWCLACTFVSFFILLAPNVDIFGTSQMNALNQSQYANRMNSAMRTRWGTQESPIYDNFIAVCLFLPNDVQ